MPTTTNFGWTTPADTDLVKDGASAIRTLGNGIDTSLVDLKGGTTGQVLAKNSNTDMDFVWTAATSGDITEVQAGTGISVASGTGPIPVVTNTMATAIDAKGDLVVGTGADTFSRLAVGATDGHVLTVDSSTATGLKYAAAPSGMTLIKRATVTGAANTGTSFDSVFSSTYSTYCVIIENLGTQANNLQMQIKNSAGAYTSTYYGNSAYVLYNGSAFSFINTNNASAYNIMGAGATNARATIWLNGVGNTSERATYSGNGHEGYNNRFYVFGGELGVSDTWTGLLFLHSSGNITITASVYGLAK